MKKLSILLIICLSLSCLVFAQKPDALQLYRDGRNFDAAGQTAQNFTKIIKKQLRLAKML